MHWTDLHDMARLLALQDTVATSARHTSDIQELRSVDHVVVLAPGHADAVGFDLEAKTALIFPQCRGDPWFHAMRRDLSARIER